MKVAIIAKALAFLLVIIPTSQFAYASDDDRDSARLLYTVLNSAENNSVAGFRINEGGTLEELPGSPYPTNGSGLGRVIVNFNGLVKSEDGRFLFALNISSNTIAAFRVRRNGSLSHVPGSPFETGGQFPLSIALTDDILYVGHFLSRDYRGFNINKRGQLSPIPEGVATFEATGSLPLAIGFNPDGDTLVAARTSLDLVTFGRNAIDTFTLDEDTGLLTEAPGSPFVTTVADNNSMPIGFGFSPTDENQLFVSNSVDLNQNIATISTYLLGENGQLAEIPDGIANAGGQAAACWVDFTSDGRNLYSSNTNSDTITHFKVNTAGNLEIVEVVQIPSGGVVGDGEPLDIIVTADDEYTYVVNGLTAGLVAYDVGDDGRLALLDQNQPLLLPEGSFPFGLVIIGEEENDDDDKEDRN